MRAFPYCWRFRAAIKSLRLQGYVVKFDAGAPGIPMEIEAWKPLYPGALWRMSIAFDAVMSAIDPDTLLCEALLQTVLNIEHSENDPLALVKTDDDWAILKSLGITPPA